MKKIFKILLIIAFIGIIFLILFFAFRSKLTLIFNKITGSPQIVENEIKKSFDPLSLDWGLATSSAAWEPRDSHVVFVFKEKMWLMGGLNGNEFVKNGVVEYWKVPHFNDIWVSENGFDWELVAEKSNWSLRRSMSVVLFKDRLWMFGGWSPISGYRSDVWVSDDGEHWEKIVNQAAWDPREGQITLVFKDKIWMFGGVNYDKREVKNDIWYSEDGINWVEAASSSPWSPRWDHAMTIFQNKLWLTGGMNQEETIYRDVWSSQNGENWLLVTNNPPWQGRQGHALLSFKEKLWLIGRFNDDNENKGENDIWVSDDGYVWQKTTENPPWAGREDFSAVIFKDKIFIIGGMDANYRWKNDVWYSVFAM
jgi:hypothetical protein